MISIQTKKPGLHQEAFDTHVITQCYVVEPIGYSDIPDVEKGCIRTVEVYDCLKNRLDDFSVTTYIQLCLSQCDKTENYIRADGNAPMAQINYNEYIHFSDNNIKANFQTVRNGCYSEELEKLKGLADLLCKEATHNLH